MSDTLHIKLEFYGRLQTQFAEQPADFATQAATVKDIYLTLCQQHQQSDESRVIKPIINDAFCDWQDKPEQHDTVGFFPPASGG